MNAETKAVARNSFVFRAIAMLLAGVCPLSMAAPDRTLDPALTAREFRAEYPITAALTSVSEVLDCPSGARLLVAGDAYGRVLVGIRPSAKQVAFEWRATWATRARRDFLIVPFHPVQGPMPDTFRVVSLSEAAWCAAIDGKVAATAVSTDAASWPGARVMFELADARMAFRPVQEEGVSAHVAYALQADDLGPRLLLCSVNECLDRPMFADARQSQIRMIQDVAEEPGPTQTAWRLNSMTLDRDSLRLRLETTFDQSVLEQVLFIRRDCPSNPSAREIVFCPVRR